MGAGRPTDFRPEYCEQAKKLCALGAVDVQLADFFEVSEVTLNAWKKKYPKFLKSLQAGKATPNEQVKQSLFKRAIGYEHTDTGVNKDGEEIEITKHYPPDVRAQKFWLINRDPDEWRDKREVSVDLNEGLDKKLMDGRQRVNAELKDEDEED